MTARLELSHITRRFGGRPVVNDVSFDVQPGQVTCLLGPSGCGKSTTLRIIAGVETADEGEIFMDGLPMVGPSTFVPPEQRQTGLMFQDFALFPHLSVSDNVAFGLKGTRTEKRLRVTELLEKVGLARYYNAFPHELSGGEQQRVALARALAPGPRIMLMDEPFSGLDNRLRDEIRDATLDVLKEEGTAVLLVTHEPEEAMRMADEIVLMRDGRVVQKGAPYHLFRSPVDKQAAAFFSDVNVIHAKVKDGLADTAFGKFFVPGDAQGASEVDIVIRPQHLRIDFDRDGQGPAPSVDHGVWARATVERARFMGGVSLCEFRLDNGEAMQASVPEVFMPKPGRVLWLAMRRDRCFVFPAKPAR